MPTIKFINEKKEIEVALGANLRREAINAGINLHKGINGMGEGPNKILNCHGFGFCGTCRVLVTKGRDQTNSLTFLEWLKFKTPFSPDPLACLAYIEHEDTMRLACKTRVNGDIEVESGPEFNLFGENFFS
jgi:ferredoxin